MNYSKLLPMTAQDIIDDVTQTVEITKSYAKVLKNRIRSYGRMTYFIGFGMGCAVGGLVVLFLLVFKK